MSLVIRPQKDFEFERVKIDEWVEGSITEIQERLNENRKYKDKETGEWKVRSVEEVRFVFQLEGYEFKHYSRWMTKSVGKESNLFKKYLHKLLPELVSNKPVDLGKLKEIKVKMMWDQEIGKDGNIYQFVANIKPLQDVGDISVEEEVGEALPPF